MNSLSDRIDRITGMLLALSVFIPVIIFSKFNQDYFDLPKELAFQFIVLLIWLCWIVKVNIKKEIVLAKSGINWLVIIFLLINAMSLIWTTNVYLSFIELRRILFYACLYFLMINLSVKKEYIRWIISALIFAAFIESIYGIFQYCGIDFIFLFELEGKKRIIGTFGYHNFLSEFLIMIIPVMFVCYYLGLNKYQKIFISVCIAVSLLCVFLTKTRSAWIALLVSLTFMLLALGSRERKIAYIYGKWFLIVLAGIVLVSSVFLPFNKTPQGIVINRLSELFDFENGAVKSRILVYKSALGMIKDSPVLGKGIGTFGFNYLDYLSDVMKGEPHTGSIEEIKDTHNEYLQIWAEAGIFGLAAFLVFIFLYYKENYPYEIKTKPGVNKYSYLRLGLTASVTAFLVDSLFSFPMHITPVAVTFWCLPGLTVAVRNIEAKGVNLKKYRVGFKITFLLAVISILLVFLFIRTLRSFISDYYWEKAFIASQSSDWDTSDSYYKKAIGLDPENGRLHFFYGSMLINTGKINEGISELEKTFVSFKDHHLYQNLAKAYLDKGDFKNALKYYSIAVKTKLNYVEDLNNIAVVYLNSGKIGQAVNILNKVIRLDTKNVHGFQNLGIAYYKLGRFKESEHLFRTALNLAPQNTGVINNLAINYFCLGKYEKSLELFNRTLKIDKSNIQAYNNIGNIYYKEGKYAIAGQYWEKTLSIDPANQIALHNIQRIKLR